METLSKPWSPPIIDYQWEQDLIKALEDWTQFCRRPDRKKLLAAIQSMILVMPVKGDVSQAQAANTLQALITAVERFPAWAVFGALKNWQLTQRWQPLPIDLTEECIRQRRDGISPKDAMTIRDRLHRIVQESPRKHLDQDLKPKARVRYSDLSDQEKDSFDSMMANFYASMRENQANRRKTQKNQNTPKDRRQQLPNGKWVRGATLDDIKAAQADILKEQNQTETKD